MQTTDFRMILDSISGLTPTQRETLLSALQRGEIGLLREVLRELAIDGVTCPRCASSQVIGWGRARGLPRWRCKECRRTFNPLTGTALAGLHRRERWAQYAESLRRGEVLREAAERCEVHINTAHRWRHRFLREPRVNRVRLAGIAEADETFILRSAKGQPGMRQQWDRVPRKRGGKALLRGRSKENVAIFVARDRSGATIDQVLATVNADNLRPVIRKHVEPDAVLCTDGLNSYRTVAAQLQLKHEALVLNHGERIRGPFHIQNVNNYHSRWKGWMDRFHGVSTRYLPNYLGWFRALDAHAKARSSDFMLYAAFAI